MVKCVTRVWGEGCGGRVAPGLTPWRSRRSVRARLRHTVRPRAGSQHGRNTSAEAGHAPRTLSSEVTVTGNEATECFPCFPPLGPPVGSALPFPGSSEASSPASTVLWRCATPCAPLAALRCLRLAIPCGVPVVLLPAVQDTKPRAWGSKSGPHFRTLPQGGNQGLPGSRTTQRPFALFFDPGRTEHARPLRRVGMAPAMTTTKAPTIIQLSRLNRTASGLAVYASSRALPHATQNSLPAAGQALPDGISYPQGCYERFLMLLILPSRAFLAQGHTGLTRLVRFVVRFGALWCALGHTGLF